MAQIGCALWFS